MKKLQKLAGVLLALVMVMGLSVTAFADGTTYTITINNSTDGYEYTAYQIFEGDLSSDETTLSNVAWGNDITDGDDALEAVKAITIGEDPDITSPFSSCTSASDVAGVLSENADVSEIIKAFAETISECVTATGGTKSTDAGDTYTISNLVAGYYLVINTDVPDGNNTAYTSYILQVVKDVEVSPKADTPSLDKEVDSTTDNGDTDQDETSADYSVGDDVSYKLIATLPSNYGDYETYKLIFHDTMVDGLSFNNDVSVAVYTAYTNLTSWTPDTTYYTYDGYVLAEVDTSSAPVSTNIYYTAATVVSSGYAVDGSSTAVAADGCSFDVTISDTNSLSDGTNDITVTSSSLIVVSFTAKLTEEASTGKTNTASLEYSNNPNSGGEGDTGTTPEDVTTVFTFTLDVDKIDSGENPLEGAGFTLYKEVEITATEYADGTYYYIDTDSKKMTAATGDYASGTTYYTQVKVISEGGYQEATDLTEFKSGVKYYTKDGTSYTAVNTATVTTPASGTTYYVKNNYTFDGLGIGNYVLVESTTPSGYNTMDDYYITIAATTTEAADQTGSVYGLTVTVMDASGKDVTSSFTATKTSGIIDTDIKNYTGSELPTTGGIGTTIFYIVGSVLLLGAVVLLITRRRMRKA